MASTTCIRNVDWIVAWNAAADGHRYLRGGDIAVTGNTIDFLGTN